MHFARINFSSIIRAMREQKNDTLREKIRKLQDQGLSPDPFCSFACPFSDTQQAQHAACLAVNGVYCSLLETVMEKGMPCPVRLIM